MTDQFQAHHNDDGTILETVEEQVERFEAEIGMHGKSSEQSAQDLLRENMIARGIDPDALPDVELKKDWFREDDFGDAWDEYQDKRRKLVEGGMPETEEAGLDIEF